MSLSVLTVVHTLARGGTERIASNYARAYARLGHRSAVLAYVAGGMRRAELECEGVQVFAVGEDGTLDDGVAWALGQPWDVVQLHRFGWATPALDPLLDGLTRASSRPVVVDSNIFGKPDYSQAAQHIDVFLMPSRWQMWKWRKWTRLLVPRPVGVVLPSAVDLTDFSPLPATERTQLRQQHGFAPSDCVVGCIAQPSPVKWSPALFQAFARVADTRPHLRLAVTGLPDPYAWFVTDLPEPIRQRVSVLPLVEGNRALLERYSLLDVFASAGTMGESFGMVFAEALMCGIPIVTKGVVHRDNSPAEVIGPGGCVAANLNAFASCMGRVVDDPALRARMVAEGREHLRASFASDHLAAEVLRLAASVQTVPNAEREALLARDGWCTHVTEAQRRALQARMEGKAPTWQALARYVLHNPHFYRLWTSRHDA